MPTTWLDIVLRQTRRATDMPYPHWASVFLNNPIRRFLGRPGTVIERIGLSPTDRILELGPGPGYFSVELARRIAQGRLELFDLQPQMLEKARRALDAADCRNVGFHSGDASAELPFPDASFDVAFMAAVLGEVPDKSACVRSLARVLRPDGLLVFVEGFPDPDRLSTSTLRELAEPNGFAFERSDGSSFRDVVRFRRSSTP
jgi:ubiquinone/menaquinone biosynthesis C-methylase UbiE